MLRTLPDCEVRVRMIRMPNTCNCNTAKLRDKMQITVLYLHLDEYGHLLVLLSVQAVLTNGSFLGYCQYGSVLPITAVCASIYHTTHTVTLTLTLILTLSLTLNLTLTLNFTLISSYLTNRHQLAQPNMSANWITSRLRDRSAARCKNCRLVPIGYTDNSPECVDLSVRAILTITFTPTTCV